MQPLSPLTPTRVGPARPAGIPTAPAWAVPQETFTPTSSLEVAAAASVPRWTPPAPNDVAQPGSITLAADPGGMLEAQPRKLQLPATGKWMYGADGQPAHWLGMQVRGTSLREPINMFFVVAHASSAAEATQKLASGLAGAGYKPEGGHSGGYRAWLGDGYQDQLPETFSNHIFLLSNNHGRIFGPVQCGGAWVFSAAFSREKVNDLDLVFDHHKMHHFATFNGARNDVAQKLDAQGVFHIEGSVPLQNTLSGNPSTMDHDGQATVMVTS